MVSSRRDLGGFSMVELMVTIVIMMLLAAVGAPFAAGWANQAAVRQANSTLQQAMGLLKAVALRNPAAASNSAPAAVLISISGKLCVHSSLPTALNCSGAIWNAAPGASISINSASSQCVAMSSTGVVIAGSVGSTACTTTLSYTISKGSESFDGSL